MDNIADVMNALHNLLSPQVLNGKTGERDVAGRKQQ
jgi:hypothetical protein